ncbi:hypothetical protein IM774_02200 [Erysipelotrichaceae bacterium RD49]|nr:hypothetical protein [Erysipelotrichaceae bacterium RD49]
MPDNKRRWRIWICLDDDGSKQKLERKEDGLKRMIGARRYVQSAAGF